MRTHQALVRPHGAGRKVLGDQGLERWSNTLDFAQATLGSQPLERLGGGHASGRTPIGAQPMPMLT
jgi:hypothetical protein